MFPVGTNLPLFLRDQNSLVIANNLSNFTVTTLGGYNYMVLNWNTTIPPYCKWEMVYTY